MPEREILATHTSYRRRERPSSSRWQMRWRRFGHDRVVTDRAGDYAVSLSVLA